MISSIVYLTAHYCYSCAVLISREEDEEMVGRQFNSLEELEPSS